LEAPEDKRNAEKMKGTSGGGDPGSDAQPFRGDATVKSIWKILAALPALALVVILAGCEGEQAQPPEGGGAPPIVTPTPTPTPGPEATPTETPTAPEEKKEGETPPIEPPKVGAPEPGGGAAPPAEEEKKPVPAPTEGEDK
jgi:hypothetical protein